MDIQHEQHDLAVCPTCGGELTSVVETEDGWAEFSYCAKCDSDAGTRVRKIELDESEGTEGHSDSEATRYP
jgi:uncharacterized protein with PIN domain